MEMLVSITITEYGIIFSVREQFWEVWVFNMNTKSEYEGIKDIFLLKKRFSLYKKQCKDCSEKIENCLFPCIIEAEEISEELNKRWNQRS